MSVGFLTAGLASLGGCELNRQGVTEVTAAWEQAEANRPARASAYSQVPKTLPASAATATQPAPETLQPAARLRDYLVLALANNPEIAQAEQTARAKAQRIPQVTALPDPMISTKTLPTPVRTAEGDNFFILGVSQRFPVPAKLDRAGRMALEEARMAIAEWDRTRLRVVADVKRAYFRLYVVDRTISVTRDNQDLLKGLIDAIRGQLAAGTARQEDLLRAQVELSNLESELIQLRQKRIATATMLNTLLNRDPKTPIESPPKFEIRQVTPVLKVLFAKAAEANPDLARVQRQIERDKQAVELARLAYWPDFNLGFEWMEMEPRPAFRPPPNPMTGQRPAVSHLSEDGSDNWAITFGINVPIWFDKIRAGIRESRAKLLASMSEYQATRNRVYFQVEDALTNVQAQEQLARLFATTIIPQAQQTYEVSLASYMAGQSNFEYLIDNWRKWLVFTIQYHRALGQLEESVADLEQAVGLSLSEVESANE